MIAEYGASEVDPAKLLRGPKFTEEPDDFIYDVDSVNRFVELECIAVGQPAPTYKWYKEENQKQVVRPLPCLYIKMGYVRSEH